MSRRDDRAFENLLLEAAQGDEPPSDALERTQQALAQAALGVGTLSALAGASAAATTASGTAATGAASGSSAIATVVPWKFMGLSVLVGAIVGGSAVGLTSTKTNSPEKLLEPGLAAAAKSRAPTITQPSLASPPPLAVAVEAKAKARVAPTSKTLGLSDEVRLIDQARAALKEHAPKRALAILGRYRRLFPKGKLKNEAKVIEIEALAAAGKDQQAASAATSYLKTNPGDPFSDRVKKVRQGEPTQSSE